jgi:glycerol kinase
MSQQFILSIDQGTTGTTVSLINTKGQSKVKINKEFKQYFPKLGWVEHDPKDIWNSVQSALKQVLQLGKINSKQIITIGITNQRETVMAWNKITGEPIGRAIVWQCRRTSEYCEELKKRGFEKKVKEITGLVLDPYFSATKMKWILDNHSEAKKLARKSNLCFGTIDCFILWKLTGGKEFSTDVSNASRTLLMDLSTLDYSPEMLKLFSLNKEMLPKIKASGSFFGKTEKILGLGTGVPITGIIGDQQSALFGQHCFELGDAKITFGTGSFLLMNTKNRKIMSKNGLLTTVAWQLPKESKVDYALEGGAFICGAAIQWLRDELKIIQKSSDVEKLAKKTVDTGGLEFLPSFVGLSAPDWKPQVRGAMLGFSRNTKKEHIALATLEALAMQNVDIVKTMIIDSHIDLKKVRVDGGAATNNLLMQLQADYLGVNVIRPKNIETTALGAAYMAGLTAGVWTSISDLKKIDRVDKEFTGKLNLVQRNQRFKKWRHAVETIKFYFS